MELLQETRIKTEKAEAEDEHQSNKENIKGKEVEDLSQVDQNVNSSFHNAIEQEILVNKEELDKNSRDMLRKKKLYDDIRHLQTSSVKVT